MQEDIIKYRRERAEETVEEAKIMLNNEKLFAAVNRIYYAVFYEVSALLLTKGFSSSKHSGIKSMFSKEFVRTGLISKEHGEFYNQIFKFRQRGDYQEFVSFEEDEVKDWLEKAKQFITAIEKVIEEN